MALISGITKPDYSRNGHRQDGGDAVEAHQSEERA